MSDVYLVVSEARNAVSIHRLNEAHVKSFTLIPSLCTALGQREALAIEFTQVMDNILDKNLQTCRMWVPLVQRTPLVMMRKAKERVTDN